MNDRDDKHGQMTQNMLFNMFWAIGMFLFLFSLYFFTTTNYLFQIVLLLFQTTMKPLAAQCSHITMNPAQPATSGRSQHSIATSQQSQHMQPCYNGSERHAVAAMEGIGKKGPKHDSMCFGPLICFFFPFFIDYHLINYFFRYQ